MFRVIDDTFLGSVGFPSRMCDWLIPTSQLVCSQGIDLDDTLLGPTHDRVMFWQ